MSKPSLRAVLPRSHVRAHARTLYTSPFTSLHHAHLDAGLLSSMPTGRGSTVTAPTPRLSTAGGVGSSSSSTGAGQSQPDGLSQLYDISTFQPNSHSSSTSGQPTLGSPSLQVVHHPPPPATPPLQNSAPAQSGARLFPGPLPLASSSLPASLAALPPMSHYQQILATIPSNMAAPESTKRTRAAFALESAAYGIPKHRSRGMSSGPVATSSFATSSARGFDTAAASSDTDANLAVQVGEDAYFLLPSALGVSDGVGGWSQKGRSQGQPQGQSQSSSHTGPSASAQFSRRLMHFCAEEISALGPLPDAWPTPSLASSSSGTSPSSPVTLPAQAGVLNQASAANMAGPDPQSSDLLEPVAVLERAYTHALALSRADHSLCGSSTAMLAILLGDELRVAHLGDCAVCLVRNGQMVFRSEEQQWKFNHPLQLGPFSSTVPGDAQRITLKVQPGDILILSSDGMSDNLWDEDVLDEVQKFTRDRGDATGAAAIIRKHAMPSMLSEALCSRAKRASEARPRRSRDDSAVPFPPATTDMGEEVPFGRRAREEGIKFSGGKQDDISVLVAVIAPHEESTTDKTTTQSASGNFLSSSASGSSPPPSKYSLSSSPPGTNFTFRTAWSS